MANFEYIALDAKGTETTGSIKANDEADAISQLRKSGLYPTQVVPAGKGGVSSSAKKRAKKAQSGNKKTGVGGRVKGKVLMIFTRQLATLVDAGLPLLRGLSVLGKQEKNRVMAGTINHLADSVAGGSTFSESLGQHPKVFDKLYVNMVKASEMSGSFAKMLDRIAAYLQQEIETRKMVVGASIYPGIIAAMAISTTVFLLTFVLPRFAGVFKGKEEALPAPTKFLMGLSSFMVEWWWLILAVAVAGIIAFFAFIRTELGGSWWDRFKISAPLLQRMFRALYISRSLQTMGELLNAGVPMLDTIAITGDVSGNRHYKRLWRSVYGAVKQGKKVQSQLQRSPLLPRSVVQMISAGEESGKLGEVLDEISVFYAKALKDAIKAVTSMIEPIMIVVMGSVVGFIAMAIILPIFKMSSLVSGG